MSKARDKEAAVRYESKVTLTFDMQYCLPTPTLETSIAFYKRDLCTRTYNWTIDGCKSGHMDWYMWSGQINGLMCDK